MKLPWSSKKHPYTRHSAPITNGILYNGKGPALVRKNSDGNLRVTFALRRTGSSQIPLQAIRATVEASEAVPPGIGGRGGISSSYRLPKDEYPSRRRGDDDDFEKKEPEGELSRDLRPQQREGPRSAAARTRQGRRGSSDLASSALDEDADEQRPRRSAARRESLEIKVPSSVAVEDKPEIPSSIALDGLEAYRPSRNSLDADKRKSSGRPGMVRGASLSSINSSSTLDTDKKERSRKARKERRSSTSDVAALSSGRPRMERRESLTSIASGSSLDTDKKEKSRKARKERRSSTSDVAAPSSVASGSSRDTDRQKRSTKTRSERRSSISDVAAPSSVASSLSRDTEKRRISSKTRKERRSSTSDLASSKASIGSSGSESSSSEPCKTTSDYSDGSSDTIGSLKDKPHRLGDLPPEKIASGYGKWESNGTIDTAEITDTSEEQRPRPSLRGERTKLSQLLDEKIEAKMRRRSLTNPSDGAVC